MKKKHFLWFEGSTSVQMIGSWINSISIPRERCTISRLLHQRQPFLSNFAPEFSIGYFLVGYFSTGYFALWVIESIFGGEQIDGVALTRFIRTSGLSPIADMKHTCTAWNSWFENQQIKVVIASQFLNWVKKNQWRRLNLSEFLCPMCCLLQIDKHLV